MYSFETWVSVPYRLSPLEELALAADEEAPAPDDLVDVEVEVEYEPGFYTPARMSGHPDNWEPADGEDPEILSVIDDQGRDLLSVLPPEQYRALVDEAWKHSEAAAEDAKAEAQIAAYEARMESYDDGGYF